MDSGRGSTCFQRGDWGLGQGPTRLHATCGALEGGPSLQRRERTLWPAKRAAIVEGGGTVDRLARGGMLAGTRAIPVSGNAAQHQRRVSWGIASLLRGRLNLSAM